MRGWRYHPTALDVCQHRVIHLQGKGARYWSQAEVSLRSVSLHVLPFTHWINFNLSVKDHIEVRTFSLSVNNC